MRLRFEHLPPWRWLVALLPGTFAYFYAPIALGGVTPDTLEVIDRLLGHSFLLWICVLILEGRLPRLPLALAGSLLFLTLVGVSQYLNPASSIYLDEPIAAHIPWLPGSIEGEGTDLVFLNLLAMMLGGLVVRDGVASGQVRWFLFRSVALAGLLVAVIASLWRSAPGRPGSRHPRRDPTGSGTT